MCSLSLSFVPFVVLKNKNMNRLILISLVLILFQTSSAQAVFSLTEGTPALVYTLPKTELCFEIEVEKTVEKPGVFYLYSQRYLATDRVVLEEKTSYQVRGIRMSTVTVPDLNRRFSIVPVPNSALSHIVVNSQGILCGVNIDVDNQKVEMKKDAYLKSSDAGVMPKHILPLTQEYMMAGSTAKLAEGAAKQIYSIRESRLNLLTGEMDHLPADGDALKLMLNGLDRQEKELTELFIGSVVTETSFHQVTITPDKNQLDDVLFRLSANRGFVQKDDLSGVPYYFIIKPEKIQIQAPDPKAKPIKIGLQTILPAQTMVKVTDGVNAMLEKTLDIPQFGELVPLPESLFKSHKVKVKVDAETGRLLKVEN